MTEQGHGVAQPPYPREPNVHSGGKQEPGSDRELPPYEDRKKSGDEQAKWEGTGSSHEAPPREVSEAEREGVPDTDTTAASPRGVGESVVTQGNERMVNASEAAQRADQTDVGIGGRTKNVDPESPDVLTGDQGG